MTDAIDGFVTLTEASAQTGLNYETLRAKVRKGQLHSRKIGRFYLVRMSDVAKIEVRQYNPRSPD